MNVLNRIPPFSLIGAEGLFTAWIPLLSLGFCVYKRNWNNLLLYLPVLFMAVFQLLLPAHQVRYSLGFLFSFALVAVIPWISMNVGTVLAVSTPSTNGTNDICPGKRIECYVVHIYCCCFMRDYTALPTRRIAAAFL